MFQDWDKIQEMAPLEAGELIFDRFKITRTGEELESLALYGEHMVEVGQYLKRKLADRAEKCGKKPGNIANRLIIGKIFDSKIFYLQQVLVRGEEEDRRGVGAGESSGHQERYCCG